VKIVLRANVGPNPKGPFTHRDLTSLLRVAQICLDIARDKNRSFLPQMVPHEDHQSLARGLNSAKQYRLEHQDQTAPDRIATGRKLTTSGATLHLDWPLSSEFVFIEEAK